MIENDKNLAYKCLATVAYKSIGLMNIFMAKTCIFNFTYWKQGHFEYVFEKSNLDEYFPLVFLLTI